MSALSRFLPDHFDPTRPLALLAGQGRYPQLVAEQVRRAGVPLRLVAFEGETDEELWASFPDSDRCRFKVGQLGHLLNALREFGVGSALMAGRITPRRLFHGLHPDWKAARILFSLKRRNAETIFGAVAAEIAKLGVHLLDARSFLDDHLATPGCMTGKHFPMPEAFLAHGIHIAQEIARLDIGQGVVVRKGTVLVVEGFDGTDAMLRRAGESGADRMLFVKTVKPHQDYRFDVPVFGQRTLEMMRHAGIECAALHAGCTLMLDRGQLVTQAREWGIHLYGFG
jgi:DUF1009 family protein